MPSLDAGEGVCIKDFTERKEIRLEYPGACSLNFQSVEQIVLEVLLGWDSKEQRGTEDGIMGELEAWGMAVEEQARKTLHSHWLLWSKRLAEMRHELFDDNGNMNDKAKKAFCARVDKVMSASYTDNEWEVEHKCGAKSKVSEVFKQRELQVLRDARHKDLCHDINGKVMECKTCQETVSTQDIINLALNEWHINALKDENSNVKNLTIPLSKERHDIAMYRTSYDMMSGCYKDDLFWGNEDVRRILQISGDNEHYALHGPRCFKKGKECTSGSFPQASCTGTCINEDNGEDMKMLERYLLNGGKIKRTAPWLVLPKRPLGCQYLNTHNKPISTIFNCNSNVIIGDPSNTFYLTLYGSKSTQKEDKEKNERIMKALIRRLKRLQMKRDECRSLGNDVENNQGDFAQGLSMVLSALNASTSRDIVSSTMAHYLVQNKGSRFKASHEPKHLLIHQLEEILDDKAVNFTLRRTNKTKVDGTAVQWPDSSSHDYLYRPGNPSNIGDGVNFECMCAYEFTELYEKKFFSFKDMDDDKQDIIAPGTEKSKRYRFIDGHPGQDFAYVEKLKLPAVAVVSLPKGKLCLLKDLELDPDTPPSDLAKDKREDYAKMALMMFYPFRELDDLTTGGKYWPTFDRERKKYEKDEETAFWKTGFEILQNIDDREMMMQSDHRTRARDSVQQGTTNPNVDEKQQSENDDKKMIPDISLFWDDDEDTEVEGELGLKWTHDILIGKSKNITDETIISARVSSDESIYKSSQEAIDEHVSGETNRGEDLSSWFQNRSYPTLLTLISGTLVGVTNFDDIYDDEQMDDASSISDDVHNITQDDSPREVEDDDINEYNVPTLVGIARKIAREEKMKLDEKQYIAYEIIACTFLLQLVEEGRNSHSILGQFLGSALGSSSESIEQLVEHLKARGGMEQLLMFLTGPAGAGKSSAVKVAERFCLEFCAAVSIIWHDETFFFTACSGSAAALFGGVTIHSAACMNGKVTDKAREAWRGKVKILVIDEISYFSDNDLKKLDRKLKDLNGIPNKPFGGQSIIFSGDFRQFEAIKAKNLLYDRFGSQLWENSINCVIILENIHRFKDDPEYGEMLTRLWRDDLTQADREKINTRVVGGTNGVTLPSTFVGDVVYACSTNKERNAVQAGIFRDHILSTHPKISSPDLPPDHTIIIEADIQSSKSKTLPSQIGGFTRNRIIHTCGDADCIVNDTKFVDPSLRFYVGAHCMCMVDNKRLKDRVPIGNGTLCRVVGIKLSEHATSHKWQNWDGRKVNTVSAKHVDWVEFEYHPKSKSILRLEDEIKELEWELKVNQESYEAIRVKKRARTTTTSRRMISDPIIQDIISDLKKKKSHLKKEQQSRRFKLDPQRSSPTVSFKIHDLETKYSKVKCTMTQIPVILADGITGHKLQGMTVQNVIIASWGYFAKNWPYVVLSRSTTFKGLYLFEPIDMDKSFAPSRDLVEYFRRAEHLQNHILHMRQTRMAALRNDNNIIAL